MRDSLINKLVTLEMERNYQRKVEGDEVLAQWIDKNQILPIEKSLTPDEYGEFLIRLLFPDERRERA